MTIRWRNIDFDGPYPITQWDPPRQAAVYTIMYKTDPVNKPDDYGLIYAGESGDLSDRGFYKSHHKYNCWLQYARFEGNIYIGIFQMPGSTPQERKLVEAALINQYQLTQFCND